MRALHFLTAAWAASLFLAGSSLPAQSPAAKSDADFAREAAKLRESALRNLEPNVAIPGASRPRRFSDRYPWKTGIVTTVFWIGNGKGGKKENTASAWDPLWEEHFGGFDNPAPDQRREFISTAFAPRLNPFYIALPYNDVAKETTKPEAKVVIPWFKEVFTQEGRSVCRDRWIAVRNAAGKVCYAQWSDVGPFQTDHWQYVFGNEKPRPNANGGTGLNVSPAVRDYLGLSTTDVTDWKFVEDRDVPDGPWALYGANNALLQRKDRASEREDGAPAPSRPAAPLTATPPAPPVIIKPEADAPPK